MNLSNQSLALVFTPYQEQPRDRTQTNTKQAVRIVVRPTQYAPPLQVVTFSGL